ncbi:Aaa family atpase [Thalictrum thalictroides]|uniref:Aaa family atpase n=1 Tax=Thalictrum thalictroides TaxID=46969 RepID=A0A7J6V555_THATH|nr:Aaa family atpase [Thalictrum thalictroides]
MEVEMEQLLNMGFSEEVATQALAATGGNSTLKATEWILNHKQTKISQNPNPNSSSCSPPIHKQTKISQNPNSNSSSCSPPIQPKLNRFFQSKPKLPISSQTQIEPTSTIIKQLEIKHPHNFKRPKLVENPHEPLSERMRPRSIDEIIGQDHILGKSSILRSSLDCNRLPSIVLWGPPGTGKTSIAKAIVNSSSMSYRFVSLSAVTAGVKDVRDVVDEANRIKKKMNKQTVLFVDEVHRFNKSQQDSFLPVIEDGSIVFVGATTENPSFHLITPLLSRCRVLMLNSLQPDSIGRLLKRAVDDVEKGLCRSFGFSHFSVLVEEEVLEFLSLNCDGDARVALNALEIAATTAAARKRSDMSCKGKGTLESSQIGPIEELASDANIMPGGDENCDLWRNKEDRYRSVVISVTLDDAKEALQCKHLAYDRAGEEHYNLISALHKSMRGSDANAAIYWLARMLEGGEQPLYIARRLIRFASEDVGLADPTALPQAVACYQACHFLGMPECNVNLAQCVAYLALAPKSIAVYQALGAAQKVVKESGGQNEGVPLHLRNAPTKLMKDFGYGKGYIYPPNHPSESSQTYLPPSLHDYKFLDWPANNMGT